MHTFVRFLIEGCHEIDISQKSNPDVQKREPEGLLPLGDYYYTAKNQICKYPIVTKIGKNFREKAYSVEFYAY